MTVFAHWCPKHREPVTELFAAGQGGMCWKFGCHEDLVEIECVPAEQLLGAVQALDTLERALADALSSDPARIERARAVATMFADSRDPGGR